jgi:hypothetical protein
MWVSFSVARPTCTGNFSLLPSIASGRALLTVLRNVASSISKYAYSGFEETIVVNKVAAPLHYY